MPCPSWRLKNGCGVCFRDGGNVAKEIRDAILRLNPEERPVTCDAQVVGGWRRDWEDEGHYGVKLSLSYPLKLAQ